MTQNQFEITQSHLVPGNHIGDALCTMPCTGRVVFVRSIFLASAFFQGHKTQGQGNKSSGFGETAFAIIVLTCVFVYSKRNICIYSYTIHLTAPDLSFLFKVKEGRKGEAELNPAIQLQNTRTIFFALNLRCLYLQNTSIISS